MSAYRVIRPGEACSDLRSPEHCSWRYNAPMTQRLRTGIGRLLLLFLAADFLGFGLLSGLGAADDPHAVISLQSTPAPGGINAGLTSPGCDHSCHFAQHLVAPVTDGLSAPPCFSSYTAPVLAVVSPTTFRKKAPFHPPRALA